MKSSGQQKIIKKQISFLDSNQTLYSHPTNYCWWALTNNGDKSKINTHILDHLAEEDRSPKKWVEAGMNYGSWRLIDRSGKSYRQPMFLKEQRTLQ
jgi:hypothetical protein